MTTGQRRHESIVPPATIGVLGGGQLGRYTLMAARQMGYGTVVLDPDPQAPAGAVADIHVVAPYDDDAAADQLAERCAVVTTEFENPPAATLARLAERVVVAPDPSAVAIAQDRRAEKRFLGEAGFPVGPFAVVDAEADLAEAAGSVGLPAILKIAAGGYDGKGQADVTSGEDLAGAWADIGAVPCVLERRLDLDAELSVIVARSRAGEVVTYEPAANEHVGGILDVSVVPSTLTPAVVKASADIATELAVQLGYVGVLAVELFVVDGGVLVSELAPRPHNSGHWTLDAAVTSQFAQQLRAVCGLVLGPTAMTAPAASMVNLLGDRWEAGEPDWSAVLTDPSVRLHLYGKRQARPGRKMGHLTVTGDDPLDVRLRATGARDRTEAPSSA